MRALLPHSRHRLLVWPGLLMSLPQLVMALAQKLTDNCLFFCHCQSTTGKRARTGCESMMQPAVAEIRRREGGW